MAMMHAPVFDQLVRERLERKPFQPFVIEFDNGKRLVVEKREALMAPSYGNTVYFGPNNDLTFVDCVAVKQLVEGAAASS
jgi:hypothetical protein